MLQYKRTLVTVLAAVAAVAAVFGVEFDAATQTLIVDQTSALVASGSALGATAIGLYGRATGGGK